MHLSLKDINEFSGNNKVRHKFLKLFAGRLPVSYEIVEHTEYTTETLDIEDEIGVIHETVVPMSAKNKVLKKLNHYRRLKRAHAKNGVDGIIEYVYWLDDHNRKLSIEIEDLKLKRVDDNILGIMAEGVKGFWSSIAMFLVSFLTVFGVKNEKVA